MKFNFLRQINRVLTLKNKNYENIGKGKNIRKAGRLSG